VKILDQRLSLSHQLKLWEINQVEKVSSGPLAWEDATKD